MLKWILFGACIVVAAAQLDMRSMMMMNMMGGGMGGIAGGGTGGSSKTGGMDMNEVLLCRNTEHLVYVQCANNQEVCNFVSMQKYHMPNVLKCSALGTGCCIKDMATMMLIRNSAKK